MEVKVCLGHCNQRKVEEKEDFLEMNQTRRELVPKKTR